MEDLLAEEADLVLERFDYASAWDLGARIRAMGAERRLPIAVEVFHGTAPVFFALLPGATPDNSEWIRRKRAVALRFHHSSLYMRLLCESKGVRLSERYGPARDRVRCQRRGRADLCARRGSGGRCDGERIT